MMVGRDEKTFYEIYEGWLMWNRVINWVDELLLCSNIRSEEFFYLGKNSRLLNRTKKVSV